MESDFVHLETPLRIAESGPDGFFADEEETEAIENPFGLTSHWGYWVDWEVWIPPLTPYIAAGAFAAFVALNRGLLRGRYGQPYRG